VEVFLSISLGGARGAQALPSRVSAGQLVELFLHGALTA
jgi:hypothetical protein